MKGQSNPSDEAAVREVAEVEQVARTGPLIPHLVARSGVAKATPTELCRLIQSEVSLTTFHPLLDSSLARRCVSNKASAQLGKVLTLALAWSC